MKKLLELHLFDFTCSFSFFFWKPSKKKGEKLKGMGIQLSGLSADEKIDINQTKKLSTIKLPMLGLSESGELIIKLFL